MPDRDDESFLARWSRRKIDVRRGREVPPEPAPSEAQPQGAEPVASDTGPAREAPDRPATEAPLEPASLPRVEDLTADSDLSAFLRRGIPPELQRLALRKAWALDPRVRDFIEVAENQYDFNNPASIPGFGELPSGGDVQTLLAQATGRRWPAAQAHDVETGSRDKSSQVAPRSHSDADAASQHDPPSTDERRAAMAVGEASPALRSTTSESPATAQNLPEIAASDEPRERTPGERTVPPSRRRHGGALPSLNEG